MSFATVEPPDVAPSPAEPGRWPATTIVPVPSRPTTPPPPGRPAGRVAVVDTVSIIDGTATPGQFAGDTVELETCCIQIRPGRLTTAAAWLDADRMYLASPRGQVSLLNVVTGEIKTVLEGLSRPQGLTVLEGRLYIADMGNICALLTAEERRVCWPLMDRSNRQILELLSQSSARILSYRVDETGELADPQVVLEGILGVGVANGPKGLTNDGEWVYASIAYPVSVQLDPDGNFITAAVEQLAANGGRPDLMGTVVRFRPGDTEVKVYASGLHSTDDLAVAPDGTIYGVDRALGPGFLVTSGQQEELNELVEGGFYGYPFWGSNEGPWAAQVTEPKTVLKGAVGEGIYANEQGIYVGYKELVADADYVVDRFDYETFKPTRIFDQGFSGAKNILEREGLLYLLDAGNIYVIDPGLTAAEQSSRFATKFAAEVDQSIVGASPQISFNYEVYIRGGDLVYVMEPCVPADLKRAFWLHITPVEWQDLGEYRREYGFESHDFRFEDYGVRSGQRCVAVVPLPKRYAIGKISTGFFDNRRREGVINLAPTEPGGPYQVAPSQEFRGGPGDGL